MKITKASIKDFEDVLKVKLESKEEERRFNKKLKPTKKVVRNYKEYLQNDLTNRWRAVFLAKIDNEIVGLIVGKIYRSLKVAGYERCGFISNVYVRKGFRKKGIAQKLIKEMMKWLKKKGAVKISLELYEKNIAAIKLYKKFGFKNYSIKMKKEL